MNADDENKLQRIANLLLGRLDINNEPDEQEFDRGIVLDELREAYALGRRAGMTDDDRVTLALAAAVVKVRDR